MATLTTKRRNALPSKDFAVPGRKYPVDTANRARNALSRVSQFGSSEEKAEVRAKVHRKYPSIGKGGEPAEERSESKRGKMMMSENERMFRDGMVSAKSARKHMKSMAAPAKR